MIKRIFDNDHSIGNYSWDHPDLSKLTTEQVKTEVEETDKTLSSITGLHTHLFRPPYGAASQSVVNELASMGYKVIDWSVDTRDWAGTSPTTIMKYVKKEFKPGGIILEHCAGGKNENLDNTVKALPEIISYLKGQGYTFVTIPELLGLPIKSCKMFIAAGIFANCNIELQNYLEADDVKSLQKETKNDSPKEQLFVETSLHLKLVKTQERINNI